MEKKSKSMIERLQGAKASVKSDLAKLKEPQKELRLHLKKSLNAEVTHNG